MRDLTSRVLSAAALLVAVLALTRGGAGAAQITSSGGGASIDPATTGLSWTANQSPEIKGSDAGALEIRAGASQNFVIENSSGTDTVYYDQAGSIWRVTIEAQQSVATRFDPDGVVSWSGTAGAFTPVDTHLARGAAAVVIPTDSSPTVGAGALGLREDVMLPGTIANSVLLAAEDVGGRSRALIIPDVGGNIHLGGRLNLNTTAVGTGANTTKVDLQTYSLPANTLGTASGVRITAAGTAVGTLDVQTIELVFGGTVIATVSVPTASTKDWDFECLVLNDAANNAQVVISRAFEAGVADEVDTYRTAAINTTLAVTIKTTGTTPNASDEVTSEILLVELVP